VLVPVAKLRAFHRSACPRTKLSHQPIPLCCSGLKQQREAILQAQLAAMRQRVEDLTYSSLLGGLDMFDADVSELLEQSGGTGQQ
jgi:hypothetical protein